MDVVEVVDNVLLSLGYHVREVIYWYMQNNFSLRREDIPRKPEKFIKVLESIYGQGAAVLEEMLVRAINKEFDLDAVTFPEAVKKAKKKLK